MSPGMRKVHAVLHQLFDVGQSLAADVRAWPWVKLRHHLAAIVVRSRSTPQSSATIKRMFGCCEPPAGPHRLRLGLGLGDRCSAPSPTPRR